MTSSLSTVMQRAFCALTIVFELLRVAQAVEPISLVPPGGVATLPRGYFGMHINDPAVAGNWPAVPFGAWRLWDTSVAWMNVQPARASWDFSVLDARIARAQSAGVEVILPLGLTPTWASARPTEPSAYGPGHAAEPAAMADWRSYVSAIATRYRGRIVAYEMWNEVADKPFYSGTLQQMIEMTRIAHDEIKRIDPAALIVAPSYVGLDKRIGMARKFLDAGGANWVDVVSYHLYHPPAPPESMIDSVRSLRADLDAGGYARLPIWNTESGYFMANSPPMPQEKWTDYELQVRIPSAVAAPYVVRDLLLARALGVERYFWYAWDNQHLGLIEPADKHIRGIGVVFGNAVTYLMRSTLQRCARDGSGVWICELTLANGKAARVIWLDPQAGRASLTLPSPFAGRLRYFDGRTEQTVAAGQQLSVSGDAALLTTESP